MLGRPLQDAVDESVAHRAARASEDLVSGRDGRFPAIPTTCR